MKPIWGAAVMGTSATAIASYLLVNEFLGQALVILAAVMAVVIVGVHLFGWIRNPKANVAMIESEHTGSMTATMPGALLAVSVALGRIFDAPAALLTTLITAGTVIALIYGWMFLGHVFTSTPDMHRINGTWFVPPVVVALAPLAMVPLAQDEPGLLPIAWALLGIGSVLYFIITAALFVRIVAGDLPPAPMAPSLIIGMGPAALISLVLLKVIGPAALPWSTALWGFSLWWAVTALLVMVKGYDRVPFGMPWWAFTFPVGIWVVNTEALATAWDSGALQATATVGAAVLLALWLYVAARVSRLVVAKQA